MTGEVESTGCMVIGCLTVLAIVLALACVIKFLWTYLMS